MYKGDSGSKKYARLEAWFEVQGVLGEKRFRAGRHLFVCGPNAADVGVLTGLGVPIVNLVGVDRDVTVAGAARVRWPDLHVEHVDVLEHLSTKREYDSINLDFCAQVTESSLDTVALAVLEGVTKDGVVALTFLAGREQPGDLHEQVTLMRRQMQRTFKGMTPERRELWKPMLPALSRFWVLQRALVARTRAQGKVPVPVHLFFYKSRQAGEHKGMPMCVYLAQVKRCPRTSGSAELTAALEREPELHFIDPTSAVLGRRAAYLQSQGYDPCMLFDVTKRELAAWKAHATRRAK